MASNISFYLDTVGKLLLTYCLLKTTLRNQDIGISIV